ncbi:MAG: chemotaxis protein CheA [Actinobacteria bacterium]|jgi:two-component system chemotaxis sensor kinase CheA|nr:chemotaxis protein CheA [Actinomycetota bacterium]MCL6094591.1 chemotaxis protein CheA [Actinomycetota bacterium]
MDEIIEEFLTETNENLDQLDQDLVALEQDPTSVELLGSIFRTMHTLKGTSGFLGFNKLEELAHAAESLLSKLRDGILFLTPQRVDVLLAVVDEVRGLLASIEANECEDDRDLAGLLLRLEELQSDDAAAPPSSPADVPQPSSDADLPVVVSSEGSIESQSEESPFPGRGIEPEAQSSEVQVNLLAQEQHLDIEGEQQDEVQFGQHLEGEGGQRDDTEGEQQDEQDRSNEPHRSVTDRSIRVDVDLLDALMRQVGELVLARNQLMSHPGISADQAFYQTVQRLSLIVSELQEGVMKTRMQPVEQLWSKLPRIVRDLCKQSGKEVILELDGGDTELDRSLLEAMKDPFLHLVRNAVDHGIESPQERAERGKPRAGTLSVKASHEGGQVVIEVSDDGAGITPSKLAAVAVKRGVVSQEELVRMSEREIIDLIFRPGFSTAEKVTNVSGRGVGMDVVRTNIEHIGGSIDVNSTPGEGTTFRLKIPLTLAIIPALLVGSSGHRFAIPQASLLEMVRLEGSEARAQIELIGQSSIYRLRGRLLPLVRLDEVLKLDDKGSTGQSVNIVVLQTDEVSFGLVVDEVFDTQEIVVKPLGRHVKHLPLFAGATILGDGTVALILDVPGMANLVEVAEGASVASSLAGMEADHAGRVGELASPLLVLRVGTNRKVAVNLADVARLEEVSSAQIEHAGGREVVQYRGQLLSLVRLEDVLELSPKERVQDMDTLPVVVFSTDAGLYGLVASEILDIVTSKVEIEHLGDSPGITGSMIISGMAIDMLDVDAAIAFVNRGHSSNGSKELGDSLVELEVATSAS